MSFEEQVRDALAARAETIPEDPDLATTVMGRARRSRRRAWLLRGLVAVLSILVAVVLVTTNILGRGRVTAPDPRATAGPAKTATPTPSTTVSTGYSTVEGPAPTVSGTGADISLMPRVERRGTRTWFVAPGVSVVLPTTVNGARRIMSAGSGWVVFTISDGFTGGDTDSGAQILAISSNGAVRTLVTGEVRSVAVNPAGSQMASVETTQRPWTITLVIRRISDAGVVSTVDLTYGQAGHWPYTMLLWTSRGILASDQSQTVSAPRSSIVVQEGIVSDMAPVTGILVAPGDADSTFATFAQAGQTCLGSLPVPVSGTSARVCGSFGSVVPLSTGILLSARVGSDSTQAAVIDLATATVTRLTVPAPLAKTPLDQVVVESTTTVLVLNPETKVWWRWDVVRNTVEQAPLPAGASAVISW